MFNLKKTMIKKELEFLYSKELINKDDFEKIKKHYEFKSDNASYLAILLGFLFLGLSLLCLVAYNWQDLSRALQTTFLLALLLLTQVLSLVLKNENLKIAFAFFSIFALLANMALLSQLYHLGDNTSFALLLAALCALVLASHFNSFWLFMQSYILAYIAFASGIESFDGLVAHFFVIFLILGFLIQFLTASKILAFLNFIFLYSYVNFLSLGFKFYNYDFLLGFLTWYVPICFIAIRARNYYNLSYFTLICLFLFYSFNINEMFFYNIANFPLNIYSAVLILLLILNLYLKRFFIAFLICAIYFADLITSFAYARYEFDIVSFYFSMLSLALGLYLLKSSKIYLGLFAVFAVAFINFVDVDNLLKSSIYFTIFAIFILLIGFFIRNKNEK